MTLIVMRFLYTDVFILIFLFSHFTSCIIILITPISTYRRLLVFIEFKILIVLTEILKNK